MCINKNSITFSYLLVCESSAGTVWVLSNVNVITAGIVWVVIQQVKQTIVTYHYNIEAETKWPPFRRRHFQTHFLEWKC